MMCQNVLFYFIVQPEDTLEEFDVHFLTVGVIDAVNSVLKDVHICHFQLRELISEASKRNIIKHIGHDVKALFDLPPDNEVAYLPVLKYYGGNIHFIRIITYT
jgi:hypothetical protein